MSHKPWEHAKLSGSESDPLAMSFVASLAWDKRLFRHDIMGSRAQARMLARQGVFAKGECHKVLDALDEIEREIEIQADRWYGWRTELEDVHMCIEAALIKKTGDAGRKLHTGRSRNDQVALDLRLWAREAIVNAQDALMDLVRAFVACAEKHGEVVMPSYTHLQRAQPIVAGGELLAWAESFARCSYRLHLVSDLNDECPLGSGAIAGSCLDLDRESVAEELEFSMVSRNSIDATASRDAALDLCYALSMVSMWLSRWAEQWIIYSSTEFGFIRMGDAYTTGSSMMPQKRNPDMLELIRGRTGTAYGSLMALMTMCKGLTIGYNRDLQDDKKHLFASYDNVMDCLQVATGIVNSVSFDGEHIKRGLEAGFLDATSLAEYLVNKKVSFRTSHQIVGYLVQLCDEKSLMELSQLTLEDFNQACSQYGQKGVVTDDVYSWLRPEHVVGRYRSQGNAGLSGFREQLVFWKSHLETSEPEQAEDGEQGEQGGQGEQG